MVIDAVIVALAAAAFVALVLVALWQLCEIFDLRSHVEFLQNQRVAEISRRKVDVCARDSVICKLNGTIDDLCSDLSDLKAREAAMIAQRKRAGRISADRRHAAAQERRDTAARKTIEAVKNLKLRPRHEVVAGIGDHNSSGAVVAAKKEG